MESGGKICFLGTGALAAYCRDQMCLNRTAFSADLSGGYLLISVQHPRKINADVLARFKYRVNLHTGLLPANKGVHTCAAPILHGDALSGVTLHEMTDVIDGGDILMQRSFAITDTDTCDSLYTKAVVYGIALFGDFLAQIPYGRLAALFAKKRSQRGEGYRTLARDINFSEAIKEADPLAERKKRAYFFPRRQFPILVKGGSKYRLTGLFPEVLEAL
jgi:methionyl-tRNA formyltransferase